jgi:taurine dioxygenase
MALELEQLTPVIGSEVHGIDLNRVDAAMAAKIKTALNERLVLVFRDQSLNRDAHKRFAHFFGTGQLQRHPLSRSRDPEILDVKTDKDSKFTAGEGWHTDVSCEAAPISASMLYLTRMPEGGGGDTLFANMVEAYERLSEPVKALVRTLKAVHDGALPWKTIYGIDPKPGTTYPRYEHPVVIRHPDTGRAVLFVNRGFTTHLTGVSAQENRFLLEMLFNHIEASPQIQCRVQWRPNTLVMWDNVATQHHAVWDYFPQSRYAERVSSLGVELSAAV